MTAQELLKIASEVPIVPVFSHEKEDVALSVLETCYKAGIRVFEFTNRSEKAAQVYSFLWKHKDDFPGLALGIGTIMDVVQGRQFLEIGTDFIVAPILDLDLAALCQENSISWTPGCGTLTEAISATRHGAGLVKVFPADVLGPNFIKSAKGPCPHLNLMPTGGVAPEKENLTKWFSAGAHCVGMGSQLIPKNIGKSDSSLKELGALVKKTITMVNEIRSGNV